MDINSRMLTTTNLLRGIALCAVSLFAVTALATPKIEHWTTKNGARIYFVPAPEIPMIDIQVVFDAGAARDDSLPGLALLTNGLLSEGAGKLSADQIAEKFESLGANFSNSSHRDMSVLSLRSLTDASKLEPALDLFATIINKPDFPSKALKRERQRLLVSLEQRKQSPDELGSVAFYKDLYPNHPYANDPSGEIDSVKKIKVRDMIQFFDTYYVAKNAVIAIVGAVDRNKAEQIAEHVIGKLKPGEAAPIVSGAVDVAAARTDRIDYPSAQTHVLVGQPGMSRGDPDYFALYVGNHVLGGNGLVSRLSDEIREKRGLSYSAYSGLTPMRDRGPYIFSLQTRNDSAMNALQVLRDEIKKFVDNGPSEKELEAAKKNISGGFPLQIASNKSIVGYIGMIGFYGLPLDYLDTFTANIDAVTVDKVKDAFKRRVHPDRMITVLVGPPPTELAGTKSEAKENKKMSQ